MTPLDVLCEVGRRWAARRFWAQDTRKFRPKPGPFWHPAWSVPPSVHVVYARRVRLVRAEFVQLGAP